MAIRPVDIQGAIFQATQVGQTQRQAEVAPQTAQTIAAQQFANKLEERQETVHEAKHSDGNKVQEKGEQDQRRDSQRRRRQPGEPQEALENSVLGTAPDGEHLIDFTA